jgi:actin-related protein 7
MDSVVVLDPGSHTLKAGYAYAFPSAEEPRVVTPTAVEVLGGGAQAAGGRGGVEVRHPVRGGQIEDWDGLESLIHYSLYDLLGWAIGDEGAVVMAEPLLTGRSDREHMAQLMFEVFNVNG